MQTTQDLSQIFMTAEEQEFSPLLDGFVTKLRALYRERHPSVEISVVETLLDGVSMRVFGSSEKDTTACCDDLQSALGVSITTGDSAGCIREFYLPNDQIFDAFRGSKLLSKQWQQHSASRRRAQRRALSLFMLVGLLVAILMAGISQYTAHQQQTGASRM